MIISRPASFPVPLTPARAVSASRHAVPAEAAPQHTCPAAPHRAKKCIHTVLKPLLPQCALQPCRKQQLMAARCKRMGVRRRARLHLPCPHQRVSDQTATAQHRLLGRPTGRPRSCPTGRPTGRPRSCPSPMQAQRPIASHESQSQPLSGRNRSYSQHQHPGAPCSFPAAAPAAAAWRLTGSIARAARRCKEGSGTARRSRGHTRPQTRWGTAERQGKAQGAAWCKLAGGYGL